MRILLRLADILSHAVLILFMALVITVAVVTSLLRYYLPDIDEYKEPVFAMLAERTGIELSARQVDGQWSGFKPRLVFHDLSLKQGDFGETVRLDRLGLELNIVRSLFYRQLHFSYLEVVNLDIALQQNVEGNWSFARQEEAGEFSPQALLDQLWAIDNLELKRLKLSITPYQAEPVLLPDVSASVQSWFNEKNFTVEVRESGIRRSKFVAETSGSPGSSGFFVNIYWQTNNLELQSIVSLLGDFDITAQSKVTHEMWLRWQDGKISGMGEFAIDQITLELAESEWQIDQPEGQVYVEGDWQQGISFAIPQLHATVNQQPVSIEKIKVNFADTVSLQMQQLDLATAENYLRLWTLPERLQELFDSLGAEGRLKNILLQLDQQQGFVLQANAERLSAGAWNGAPALGNINGFLEVTKNSGYVLLDSPDYFSMTFPGLFTKPMVFESASGRIFWRIDENAVHVGSEVISLSGIYGHANGEFHLYLPHNAEDKEDNSRFSLAVTLQDSDVDYRNIFLPTILEQGLLDWLDSSIVGGKIPEAAFIFHGPLDASPEQTIVQLWLDIAEGEILYADDFLPVSDIRGEFLLDQGHGFARVQSANGGPVAIDNAEVLLRPLDQGMQLHVNGRTRDTAANTLAFLQQPALSVHSNQVLDEWQAETGKISTGFEIAVPLYDIDAMTVDVTSQLSDVDLAIEPYDIVLEKLQGELNFSLADGLSSPGFSGRFWGRPLSGSIRQVKSSGQAYTSVQFLTTVESRRLQDWLEQPVIGFFDGQAAVSGDVYFGDDGSGLRLNSRLAGIVSDLPAPFAKAAAENRLLRFHLPFTGEQREMSIQVDDGIDLRFLLDDAGVQAGKLTLGIARQDYQPGQLAVTGHLFEADAGRWIDVVSRYQQMAGTENDAGDGGEGLGLRVSGMHIRHLTAFGYQMQSVNFNALREAPHWHLRLQRRELDAELVINDDAVQPMQANIAYIDLALLSRQLGFDAIPLTEENLSELPAIDFDIQKLSLNESDFGRWRFALRNRDQQIVLNEINALVRHLQLGPVGERPCSLTWSLRPPVQSAFDCRITSGDVAQALRAWGYQQAVYSEETVLDVRSHWQGDPLSFSLLEAQSVIGVSLQNGNFADVATTGTDALKVLGLINFNRLVRRLQLDFSDLTSEGLAFDRVRGVASIDQGVLYTDRPFVVRGASSQIRLAGLADLNTEELDMTMTVSLPLASNLPWVAALAAGLPAAASVYVISRLLGTQVDKLSSAVYDVTGDMADPKIQFRRLFDAGDEPSRQRESVESAREGVNNDS